MTELSYLIAEVIVQTANYPLDRGILIKYRRNWQYNAMKAVGL